MHDARGACRIVEIERLSYDFENETNVYDGGGGRNIFAGVTTAVSRCGKHPIP